VSIAGGVENAPLQAAALGARGFGMFTKNQQQWRAAAYTAANRTGFAANLRQHDFAPDRVLPHAGYLINLANPGAEPHARSVAALIDEMRRCAALGLDRLNLHPGSHLRQLEPAAAAARVAAAIDRALAAVPGVTVVLESTAGQGACIGASFEDLAAILERVGDAGRVGVCLDTAHMFAAGYDLRTRKGYEETVAAFDRVVGLRRLRGMHLNDSRTGFRSRVDRHESLGKGHLGWKPFEWIMNDPRFDGLPLVIETPDEDLWAGEIRALYALQA
jgi:deoxyribonuclease-4